MAKPVFSIIIPTLNEEKYLPRLLQDLATQSYREFEVIIVDGNSNDGTLDQAKKFRKLLPYLKVLTSPKRHVCIQRNRGAEVARADTFVFMDADNRLPSFFLQGLKYRLETTPIDIATCWFKSDSDSKRDKNIAAAINLATDLLKNSPEPLFMESLTIANRDVFNNLGGFDPTVHLAEGRALNLKARKMKYTFTIFKDPWYIYSFRRIHKYGPIQLLGNNVFNEIANLFAVPVSRKQVNDLYPMVGGSYFDTKGLRKADQTKKKIVIRAAQKLLNKIANI